MFVFATGLSGGIRFKACTLVENVLIPRHIWYLRVVQSGP